MRLKHLEMENFCQHKKFARDFHRGVTGIFGPNGSGKSNLLAAVKVNLCNDYSTNNGTKALSISRSLGRRDRSFVRAVWEHDGQEFELIRGLKPVEHSLRIGSAAPILGDAPVQEALNQILKTSLDTVGRYLFVDQWRMFSFVEQQDAARMKAFAQLCGAEEAEKIWVALGKELDALAATESVDVRSACAELGRQVGELQARSKALTREQRSVPGLLTPEQLASKKQRIAAFEARAKLVQEAKVAIEGALALDDAHQAAAAELGPLQAEHEELSQRAVELKEDVSKLDMDNVRYTQRQRLLQKQTQATNAEQKFAAVVSQLSVKSAPAHKETLEELQNARGTISEQKNQLEQAIEMFTGKENCCPLCGSSVADPAALVITLRAALKGVQAELVEVVAKQTAQKKAEQEWQTVQTSLREAKDGVRAQRIVLSQVAESLAAYEDLKDWNPNRFVGLQAELTTVQYKLTNLKLADKQKACETLGLRRDLAQTKAEQLSQDMLKLNVKDKEKDIEKLRLELAAAETAAKVLRDREAEIAASEQLLKTTTQRLQELQALQEQGQARSEWKQDVAELRELFHRNNLPSLLLNRMFNNVVDEMNRWLEIFGKPFSVSGAAGLALIAERPNGDRDLAARLSGGQKVMLAMTYWPAINSLFAGSVGFLGLDEPTAGLDNDRIDCLRDLMVELRSSAKQNDQQILLVTHDERLEPALDNVIHLERS